MGALGLYFLICLKFLKSALLGLKAMIKMQLTHVGKASCCPNLHTSGHISDLQVLLAGMQDALMGTPEDTGQCPVVSLDGDACILLVCG